MYNFWILILWYLVVLLSMIFSVSKKKNIKQETCKFGDGCPPISRTFFIKKVMKVESHLNPILCKGTKFTKFSLHCKEPILRTKFSAKRTVVSKSSIITTPDFSNSLLCRGSHTFLTWKVLKIFV